ncbi:formate dehydrogenase accessory protein FdhE [Paenirhodobacter populi]|uniref:Protein FdhE homolog n=1 Tax=Paenirhodobacter populi TaxID=2306993 RepID=A0A443JKS3_9RHOB|nr:formate dehydrogenase accessory protein FdhE [Sinirhodobacter populi]RWR21158.1 formate dehydrogenase accessory protein FdhE [Sinirhodobacter populi]
MTTIPALRPAPEGSHFDPLLRPDLGGLYAARADRLRHLAEGHELAGYLRLAADVAQAQADCLGPVAGEDRVDPLAIAGAGHWIAHLDRIVAEVAPKAPETAREHFSALAAMDRADRLAAGKALAEGRFADVDPALAPIFWAALSVEVAMVARAIPLPDLGTQESTTCPVCGTAPVASVIHISPRQGFRYLHCPLCECEWHMVRAKCSNCGDAKTLDYLSFDTADATVRAEACGACGGYLKVVSQERDPAAEVVADDLATLALDDASVAEGYGRSGFNPFALPG